MRSTFKLVAAILLTLGYILLAGIIWLDQLWLQISLAFVTSLLLILRKGIHHWFRELLLLLPLILTLMVVYLIFSLLRIKPGGTSVSASAYWIAYGSVRALILLSSLFFIQFCFSFIRFEDILSLPISIHQKKYLILGKTLYRSVFSSQDKLLDQISLIPTNQEQKHGIMKLYQSRMTYLLAVLYMIVNESNTLGELIDNRISCCHKET
ncbi:MAG TPA: hypothetical protein PKI15_08100 [Candidatus Cloacimonadota bacterium]|nr:hypothetical protein [Candidatus Cloacimonadota bacterium]